MKSFLVYALALISGSALAQVTTPSNVTKINDVGYTMTIDGQEYIAVSRATLDDQRKLIKELQGQRDQCLDTSRSLEKLRTEYVALTETYQSLARESITLNEKYSDRANALVQINDQYGNLVKDYDNLAGKYRDIALRPAPRHATDFGLGLMRSGGETRPVGMVGMGGNVLSLDVRGWLMGGQDTFGLLIGASF